MKSLEALLKDALRARLEGDLEQAKTSYEKILQHAAELITTPAVHAEVHNNLGVVYYKQGNFADALTHYAQAVQLQPDYLEAHLNLGLLFLQRGEQDAAIKQFCNALALYPDSFTAHWQLANLYLMGDRLDDAIKHYRVVLQKQPEHIEALNNLGVVLLKQNKPGDAIEYFNKVLILDPHQQNARSNLAAVLLQLDRFKDAIWHYQLYLRLTPDDSDAHYNLGVAYMAAGHLTDAIQEFEKTLELVSGHVDALCNLGAVYLKLEDRAQAVNYYRRALELQPKNEAIRFRLGALTGESTLQAAPGEYVKNLFDNYAGYFDRHVLQELHYQMPVVIRNVLEKHATIENKKLRALDLGCGTGLSGEVIRDVAKHLVGVDISTRMLAKAQTKNIYDELVEGDIVEFLVNTRQQFDLIIAADTFVYFGDLSAVLTNCYRVLSENGMLVFSTERGVVEPYQLQITGRYSHDTHYVDQLAKQKGFAVLAIEEMVGRLQQGKSVVSDVFVLRK